MLIKAQFLKEGLPQGRAYTYMSDVDVVVGDRIQLNEKAQGIVVDVDVPDEEVESFRDKLKPIVGKVEVTEKATEESEESTDEQSNHDGAIN